MFLGPPICIVAIRKEALVSADAAHHHGESVLLLDGAAPNGLQQCQQSVASDQDHEVPLASKTCGMHSYYDITI